MVDWIVTTQNPSPNMPTAEKYSIFFSLEKVLFLLAASKQVIELWDMLLLLIMFFLDVDFFEVMTSRVD